MIIVFEILGYGHYLSLPSTFSQKTLCADISTSFIFIIGKCLQLRYMQLFSDILGDIEIHLRNENLELTLVASVKLSYQKNFVADRWQTLFVKLPDSKFLHQIIVKFVRPPNSRSGIQIDDLTIRPCLDFSTCQTLFSIDVIE